MTGAAVRSARPHPVYQSKYHCYIAYFEIFSLGVWKHSTCLCSTGSSREDRHLSLFFVFSGVFFVLFFCLSEALPTCVKVWPLSACLLRSTLLCSSPHPILPLAHSLPPCGSLQDWLPSSSSLFGLQVKSSSFRNWPTCIKISTTAAPESVLSNLQLHSLSVSLLQGSLYPEMEAFRVFFSFGFNMPVCIFILLLS